MKKRITIRIDSDIWEEAKDLYEELGLDLETAINVYLVKCIFVRGIPFSIEIPPSLMEESMRSSPYYAKVREDLKRTFLADSGLEGLEKDNSSQDAKKRGKAQGERG